MVKAGEVGGMLEVVLDRLAIFAEKDEELKTKIKGAMTYPAIMMTVAVSVVGFLMISVIPTFSGMFEKMGVELPMPTKVVMAISDFLVDFWMHGICM